MEGDKHSAERIGLRIYDARIDSGETQVEAAAACGFSEQEWCKLEKGRMKRPSAERILAVAQHYGLSVEYLLTGEGNRQYSEKDVEKAANYSKLTIRALLSLRAVSHDPETGTETICRVLESDMFHRLNWAIYKAADTRRKANGLGHFDTLFFPELPEETRNQILEEIRTSGNVFLTAKESANYYEDLAASVLRQIIQDIAIKGRYGNGVD